MKAKAHPERPPNVVARPESFSRSEKLGVDGLRSKAARGGLGGLRSPPAAPEGCQENSSNPWPWFIGGLLMTVVIANAIMLTIAMGTPPILEDEDAYESSLTYDHVIAARAAAKALNWRAEVRQLDGRLEWRMLDAQARPVRGLAGQIVLRRADTRRHDRTLALVEFAPGVYRADWAGQPGAYRVDVQLERGAERWVSTREMRLR